FFLSPPTSYLLPESQSSPMLLTRICRHWREVSENMPSLWCRLFISLDETNAAVGLLLSLMAEAHTRTSPHPQNHSHLCLHTTFFEPYTHHPRYHI
ncbi:hypothetical protein P692DRAFT_20749253, partial [Suillus brevipes Sb2]